MRYIKNCLRRLRLHSRLKEREQKRKLRHRQREETRRKAVEEAIRNNEMVSVESFTWNLFPEDKKEDDSKSPHTK